MIDLLVLAHPDENSLQASLFREAVNRLQSRGREVVPLDLYREGFPCILPGEEIVRGVTTEEPVLGQQKALAGADRIFLFYPDWWGMPPALLKGWLDRVLATDVAYRWEGEDFLEKKWVPLLGGKEAVLFITADGDLDEGWLSRLWGDRVFGKCGARVSLNLMDRLRERSYAHIRSWWESRLENL